LGIGVGVAAALAYLATPVAISAARRLSFYDVPEGYKGHRRPTPYLGGAAVMLAFALATLAGAGSAQRTLLVLAGVVVLWTLGTLDDRRNLSPSVRVLAEATTGVMLSTAGLGWKLGSGPVVDAVVTGVWVIGVVNAFNLFDNMDGAASTMALVVTAGTCVLALVNGEVWVAAGSAALCGACLGFLPHNMSSPARIFLGDGGSMPLGFVVATLVANAARHAEPSSLGLLVGFLLVGIPALDTSLVIISRRRRHIPLLTGGRDHLTHRTRQRMGTPRRVAVVLGSAQALVSALVILGSRAGASALVYIVLAFIVFAAYAIVALEDAIPVSPTTTLDRADRRRRAKVSRWRHLPDGLLALIGLAAGLSPLFSAFYSVGLWVPIGLLLVVGAAMSTVARPPRFTLPVALAFFGLSFLGLWSLLSTSWANGAEVAGVSANLWLTYAALLLLLIVLIDAGGHARTLLIATGVGVVVVGLSVLVRLLGSDPGALFISGRLNSPLGYVNGEGCMFAMGAWLSIAVAERRQPFVAGLGATLTVGMACLAMLSESRGALIATIVAIVATLAAVPGFRRRVFALAIVAAGIAPAAHSLIRVYTTGENGLVPASVAHHAVVATVLSAVITGVVWGVAVAVTNAVERRGGPARALLGRMATVAAVAVVAAPVAVAAVRFTSVERSARNQWHAFVHLSQSTSPVQTRLLSGGGNRYDYWRVAWNVFTAHPLAGVGAGNYPESYYRERATDEAIQNPHSLELQTIAELGIIGGAALAAFLAGVGVGARRLRRLATDSLAARTAMTAATGAFTVWFVDSSGDWMHLLPGVTAVALCATVTLCLPGPGAAPAMGIDTSESGGGPPVGAPLGKPVTQPTGSAGTPSRLAMLLAAAAAVCVLAIGGASLVRAILAQHYLNDARAALPTNPAQAISDSQQALRIDNANLDAYYVKAAGQARFDRAAAARSTLLAAAHQAPGVFITWTLLGDLETRAGDVTAAETYYRHALRLDPREPGLAALAADPKSGLGTRP
jgi:UDP-GlcNAc:undecaprenyl-phosphate GlcNAc-1-phosphate transferase